MSTDAAEAGGNVYDKYGTRNPIARRLMAAFMADLDELVERTGAREAHEVGCGEGELSIRLAGRGLRVRGTDASPQVLGEARLRARAAGAERHGAELIVCCEVLEHLPDAERALAKLTELARPWLIASVPREPLWRALNLARLSYVRDLGNTPGHLNHWSKRAFLRLLETRFEVVEVRGPPPWTMALCRARGWISPVLSGWLPGEHPSITSLESPP